MTEASIQIEDLQIAGKVAKLVKIVGQLDESNVDEKIQEIYKVVEANPSGLNLIFDLEGLQYMNSKSIGYLTDLYGKITETGGKVVITQAKPNILDILQVVGLTQLIKTVTTKDEAMAEINGQAPAMPVAAPVTPVVEAAPTVTPAPAVAETTVTPAAPAPTATPTMTMVEPPLSAPLAVAPTPVAPPQPAAPATPPAPESMPTPQNAPSPENQPSPENTPVVPTPAAVAAPVAPVAMEAAPMTVTPAVTPAPAPTDAPAATPTYNLGQQ